ncbi:MAG TPA: aminoacyl-tRNA hydrolase, partial [Elusimicrobiales bacterium]|nr:aminoacyl-tRNA hydrolase [Elusimicrobiales bacterium]
GKFGAENVPRLRIGIGPRPENCPAKDYVLSAPSAEQKAAFEQGLKSAENAVALTLERGLENAMNAVNGGGKQ